jgi:dolichol kinase
MDIEPLVPVGWLVFAVGIAVIVISEYPRKNQVRSPTRRISGVLSGLVFCFLAGVVLVPNVSGATQKMLILTAFAAGFGSWYLGRHTHKVDRMARRK